MSFRTVVAAPLLLALALPAQQDPKPVVKKPAPPTVQDPVKPSAKQVLEGLQAEKARLQREIEYAQQRAGNAKRVLSTKLAGNTNEFRSIDAGKSASSRPAPAPTRRRFARVGSKQEMDSQPEGTMLTVGGRAISSSYYTQIMNHLREAEAGGGDDSLRAQRVLFDLIRTEAIASKFIENEGEVRLGDYIGQLAKGDEGKSLAEIIKAEGSVQTADENGRVEVTRNSIHGPFFEYTAFTTPVGKMSRPFRNLSGYVMLRLDSIEKGETPQLDKAICHVAQIDYTKDPAVLRAAQFDVNSGQIDIVVRDQEVLDLLPAMFKPPQARRPAQMPNVQQMQNQLTALQAKVKALEASGEGASDSATALRQQCEALQKAIETAKKLPPQDADAMPDAKRGGSVKKADAQKPGVKKADAQKPGVKKADVEKKKEGR